MNHACKLIGRTLFTAWLGVSLAACTLWGDDDEKNAVAPLKDLPEQSVSLHSLWSRSVGSQGDDALALALTPAIDGGTIYAANATGGVMAISRADGDVRWDVDLDVMLIGAVGAGSDLVLVASANGGIDALDAATGQSRWHASASSEVLAAPATNGDVVVVQSVDARVQAFDAATGRPRWAYSASQAVLTLRGTSAPVIHDDLVYVAFDNGKMAALDAKTGLLQWEQRFIVPDGRTELERIIDVQADPLVTSTDVVVASYQGAIISVAQGRGQPQWEQKASVVRNMAQTDDSVFTIEGNDSIKSLSSASGREQWVAEGFAGRRLSAPAVIGSYLAVADKQGYVHLLSQADGSYVGRYDVGGDGVRANLLGDGDTLYVLTNSGKLYALAIKS
ncbi:MAG TPA: outer membrane protein assembly factor BamB [Pseudomonadales bacterium]|nr:outer membrane protein assembly factor BamB [Pseudomonadales bacterium]